MSEASTTARIVRTLNTWEDTKAVKMHGSQYSRVGEPDIIGTRRGRTFVMEMKVKGRKPTRIQFKRLAEWEAAGAAVGWFDNYAAALGFVRGMETQNPLET